jgi:26S proteasome regulatory subunit N1
MKRQLAFILARAQIPLEWLQPPSEGDAEITTDEELSDDLLECLYNTRLSTHFRDFGKELGVAEAKSLEDIYKSHLENTRKLMLRPICFLRLPFPYRSWYFSKRRFCQRKLGGNIC